MKLRMEMWYMPKRQQPDQRADNRRMQPMGLQRSEKNLATGGGTQLTPK